MTAKHINNTDSKIEKNRFSSDSNEYARVDLGKIDLFGFNVKFV